MSESPHSIKEISEQNRQNIAAIARELGAEKRLEDAAGGADWAKTFGMRDTEPAEKSDTEETADLVVQNAENIVRLAEAVGVSQHRIEGKATSADWSKTLGFAGED